MVVRKVLWAAVLVCLVLAIAIMSSPNAYEVSWCLPLPGGGGRGQSFSYFNIELIGLDFYWNSEVLLALFSLVGLVCSSVLVFRLVYRKLDKASLILAIVGLPTYALVLTAGQSTNEGYPNSWPFITSIVAVCATLLLLLQLIFGKLLRPTCFAIATAFLASVPSLVKSSPTTHHGFVITGLLLMAILFYYFHQRQSTYSDSLPTCTGTEE